MAEGGRLAAPVSVAGDVCREQFDQLVEVAITSSGEKGLNQRYGVLSRHLVPGVVGVDMLAGPPEDLPAVCFTFLDNLCNVLVG